ncbi:MAG: hypothetical protein ABSB49_05885 [Polyangia bacterium]|jgi:hypothetical protein
MDEATTRADGPAQNAPWIAPKGAVDRGRTPRISLRRHWAILLPAFVYLYIFPYLPALRSPNELCRLLQSRALVDQHTLEIGEELRVHGQVGDLSCVAVARAASGAAMERLPCPQAGGNPRFREEHFFPSKAPLLAFAAAPIYGVLKLVHGDVSELALMFFARLGCVILPSILLLLLVHRYLTAMVSASLADLVTLVYALGTLAFSYSEQFVSHQTTAVLAFACFFALWRLRRGEWTVSGYAVAGFLAGLTVAAEYTGVLALLPLGAYGALTAPGGGRGRLRAVSLAFLGLLPPALALAAYHQAAFAHPLATGYRYLNDAGYQGWHRGGILGIKLPKAYAFVQSFLSPLRGLFTLSPVLLLALPRLFDPRRLRARSSELWLSLAMLLLYAYFTSGFAYESWGWTTGPRHLTPLIPFLLLPLAQFLRSLGQAPGPSRGPGGTWWQVVASGVAAGLIALSLLTTLIMTLVNYISDTFTNGLYQLALPLVLHGFLPHSWLSLAGVPNPWAAIPAVLVALVAVGACVFIVIRPLSPRRRIPALAVATVAVAAVATFHASIRPPGYLVARERQAAEFMTDVYVPRPHQPPPRLWSR